MQVETARGGLLTSSVCGASTSCTARRTSASHLHRRHSPKYVKSATVRRRLHYRVKSSYYSPPEAAAGSYQYSENFSTNTNENLRSRSLGKGTAKLNIIKSTTSRTLDKAQSNATSVTQELILEDAVDRPKSKKENVGVLLLNLGGPESLEDVEPFLYNLFADPDIIRLPRLLKFLQEPLAKFISMMRAPKSREGYASIGGGSPLRRITDDQVMVAQLRPFVALVYFGSKTTFA